VSLRLRLGVWYGALTGVAVMLVCVYGYAVHSRAHYDELDFMLRNVADHVGREVDQAGTPAEQHEVLSASLLLEAEVQLYDAAGDMVAAAPGVATPTIDPLAVLRGPRRPAYSRLAALAPALRRPEPGRGAYGVLRDETGRRRRAYVLPLRRGYLLQAIVPLREVDAAVAGFGRLMLYMAVGGAGVAFLTGWLLAGRVLRPVAALTGAAAAIARSRAFSRRFAVDSRRDELGRLAATFNEMLASLEEAYTAQQRFVGLASHELRAPLTTIQANLELLSRVGRRLPESERATALREAYAEAQRLSRLAGDLLVLARADAGQALRLRQVELDRLVLDVLGEVRHLATGQRFEVAALEPVILPGDSDRLKQLLLILLDNAVKYTPPPGKVTVTLQRHEQEIVLTIRDTGIGIEADELARVFDRFYRTDSARGLNPGGAGLGLSIARWIVREHGGTIALASTPAQGTVAAVRLPVTDRARS
jgi:two-component system OmpR family sensor kinase